MDMLKKMLVGVVASSIAGAAGVAMAQAGGQGTAGEKSKDPYVEYRQEKKEAKGKYKSGEISKKEYSQEKSQERANLQQERAAAQKADQPSGSGAASSGR